ncbi:MAG: hypothetical protein ABEJ05_01330, partial [Haloglomus sp.]
MAAPLLVIDYNEPAREALALSQDSADGGIASEALALSQDSADDHDGGDSYEALALSTIRESLRSS